MVSTRTLTGTTAGGVSLSEDTVFELLSNRRRRLAIHALKRADGGVSVSELSTRVTAWERGVDPESVDYQDRRTVHTTLTRSHLPMLDENGVVEYDAESDLVESTAVLDDLEVYVRVLRGREIPWSLHYLGVSALVVLVTVAVAVGAPLVAALSPIDAGVFAVTAFSVSAVLHRYGERARLAPDEGPPEPGRRE